MLSILSGEAGEISDKKAHLECQGFHSPGRDKPFVILIFLMTHSLSPLVVQTMEHRLVRKTQLQQSLLLPDTESLLFTGELHTFGTEFLKFTNQTHRICPECPIAGELRGGLVLVSLENIHCCSRLLFCHGILSYTGSEEIFPFALPWYRSSSPGGLALMAV